MAFRIGITKEGAWSGVVFDLLGCVAEASQRSLLLEIMPVCIAEYLTWLKRHGEPTSDEATTPFEIAEEIAPADSEAADGEFCFQDDKKPAGTSDIETAIRFMGYARTDLKELTADLPDAILDWRPPFSAMAKVDPWKPTVLTIREIVTDIANAEGYYRGGLHDGIEAAADGEPADLDAERERTLERLADLSDDERSRVFRPQRPWQQGPEHWTVRKVVRRIISHERFHTAEIRQRLAWLLLGVPDFEARS